MVEVVGFSRRSSCRRSSRIISSSCCCSSSTSSTWDYRVTGSSSWNPGHRRQWTSILTSRKKSLTTPCMTRQALTISMLAKTEFALSSMSCKKSIWSREAACFECRSNPWLANKCIVSGSKTIIEGINAGMPKTTASPADLCRCSGDLLWFSAKDSTPCLRTCRNQGVIRYCKQFFWLGFAFWGLSWQWFDVQDFSLCCNMFII